MMSISVSACVCVCVIVLEKGMNQDWWLRGGGSSHTRINSCMSVVADRQYYADMAQTNEQNQTQEGEDSVSRWLKRTITDIQCGYSDSTTLKRGPEIRPDINILTNEKTWKRVGERSRERRRRIANERNSHQQLKKLTREPVFHWATSWIRVNHRAKRKHTLPVWDAQLAQLTEASRRHVRSYHITSWFTLYSVTLT